MYRFLGLFVLVMMVKIGTIYGQLTQTIRGTIIDQDGRFPIIGATVVLANSDPLIGTSSDVSGNFRLENVAIGRHDIIVSFIGYEERIIPNLLVGSGKEVVLNLELVESIEKLDEVVVKAQKDKGEVLNEMSLVSARTFSVEETKRYAGSLQDPSRMVSAFAGVTSDPSGDNDIVVRGNSPKGILWRMEDIEIPNPNHFADEGATGGPINALNSTMIGNSDFLTSAFAPEYGNALSGVFDMRLRNGNNEKHEHSFGFGVIGTDLTTEGPFSKNYSGSYIINYRYSSLDIMDRLGIVDFDGVPKYQDLSFKVNLPTKKLGQFSVFGLGGRSNIHIEEFDTSEVKVSEGDYGAYLGVVGLNHVYSFGKKAFLKTYLAASANGSNFDFYSDLDNSGEINSDQLADYSDVKKSTLQTGTKLSLKLSTKTRLLAGIKYTHFYYSLNEFYYDTDLGRNVINFDWERDAGLVQNYVTLRHKFNESLALVTGVHYMNFTLNGADNLEPRLALKWQLNPRNTMHLGYGNHSKLESIITYYTALEDQQGNTFTPNSNLGFSKANHYILGYGFRIKENIQAKLELYYQGLYNIPVEDVDTSYVTLINYDEGYVSEALVNSGTGENFGIEFTLERFYADNYYYLFTASLFNSTYIQRDGTTRRNTKYNGNYAVNFLIGKEFIVGKEKNNALAVNAKFFINGGRRYIPVNLTRSRQLDETVFEFDRAWEDLLDPIFQVNFSVTYRINKPKTSHEIIVDIQNLANGQGRVFEYYNSYLKDLDYERQLSIIPNIMYRINF